MTDKEQLLYLIKGLANNTYDITTFCNEFTRIYDLELDYSTLNIKESTIMDGICNLTARFSDDEEDLQLVNVYVDEKEIRKEVEKAIKTLNIKLN